ncbi:MAG: transposase [Kofleriaceae bacterium]
MTRRGWWSEEKGSKNEKTKKVRRTYTRKAMEVWFRVLQTMARDAMVALDLPRDRILDQLREAPMPVLHSLATTLRSWRDEVARMWRFTKSNAITEGLHNKMEVISRRAYGFRNFQNYRLRVRALCG